MFANFIISNFKNSKFTYTSKHFAQEKKSEVQHIFPNPKVYILSHLGFN
jgi:hypothetical protein